MGDVIKVGEYIVLEKQNYRKLHKLNKPDSTVTIGRNVINLAGIEGCPYFSLFKMIPRSKKGKEYVLELTNERVELKDEIAIKSSGSDNRNIIDDGRSQKLSKEEIDQLTLESNKASDIVETLISNSNTFHNKTEYSQEKYLKKKEKKYFEYVQIVRPNLRLIAEIMYKLEPGKIQHLRLDTLSQIITMSNIHSEGQHLLYDSGSNGLVTAALLNAIGANTKGTLLHMHPGNMSQKQALLAMNFSKEQMDRCISANIYSALRKYYQGDDLNNKEHLKTEPMAVDQPDTNKHETKENLHSDDVTKPIDKLEVETSSTDVQEESNKIVKRKADDELENGHKTKILKTENDVTDSDVKDTNETKSFSEPKIPKWHFDNIAAAEILTAKVDSLVIVSKEDPQSIFMELLQFVRQGRPFVIFHPIVEPLQNLFVVLKSHPHVAALRLTCNFMRNYQVLPERTHPEVLMNNQSGFLLTGYILQ